MKTLVISILCLFTTNLFAADGKSISKAATAAFAEAAVEIELNDIEAWEAKLEGDEVEVKVLAHEDGSNERTLLAYGCHNHGADMVCHEEGDHHEDHEESSKKADKEATFAEFKKGHAAALKKLAKTLERRGADLGALTSLKVWRVAEHAGHDHDHGADIWTKAVYTLKGKVKKANIQCHTHGEGSAYFCHYKRFPLSEPTLEDSHE